MQDDIIFIPTDENAAYLAELSRNLPIEVLAAVGGDRNDKTLNYAIDIARRLQGVMMGADPSFFLEMMESIFLQFQLGQIDSMDSGIELIKRMINRP